MKVTTEQLKKLANDIMLDFGPEELEKLKNEFDVILKQMDLVQKIDTTNVRSMHFPYNLTVDYLREDVGPIAEQQKNILALAPVAEGDYIVINKVVK
ncbi:Asp-tRNA(Asn)/Glu-tRNA(Gln) amidotransferase subunit GatC [Spiroplasma chrysopicola]|uniref:Glutamyl-tRNA(Gln) amidotransferase subunit C n=1 Tax=Spiroplasma chrysopicola DF-1 TaxID=1276227 RepID=R4UH13_9MOLU|nr:Asp-tRNA(Asn)/Glu-tRNA(Gln) amidotransferase subunit GatC [Spiroplasma chrysopicola]AGM25460.1 glutamyl-tRNA(Gln) amidotransferase subunit C [Spiroplasma chrysopicola DF-1]